MLCKNCGVELRMTEKEGTIHDESSKYACYPSVKNNDPRWPLVATVGNHVEFSEDDETLRYSAI